MYDFLETINTFAGKDIREVTLLQILFRSFATYLITVFLVRWGDKRFMGQSTAFDVVLGFILGSVVSRAINGNAPFVQSLVAAGVLVLLHFISGSLIYRYGGWLSGLFEGHSVTLVRDGKIRQETLRKHNITEKDLMGSLRQWGNIDDLDKVKLATLERSGMISCVVKEQMPVRNSN